MSLKEFCHLWRKAQFRQQHDCLKNKGKRYHSNLKNEPGTIASKFACQTRSLEELKHCKATEFKHIFLYAVQVVLEGVINNNIYIHFLAFSLGISIFLNKHKIEKIKLNIKLKSPALHFFTFYLNCFSFKRKYDSTNSFFIASVWKLHCNISFKTNIGILGKCVFHHSRYNIPVWHKGF